MFEQRLTLIKKNFVNVRAKNLKKKDRILIGSQACWVISTSKNAFKQRVINFDYHTNKKPQATGTLIVDKNFRFFVTRTECPKDK